MIITDSEIYFWKNETKENITSYFYNIINHIHKDDRILYFTLSYSKEELLSKYKNFNKKNINIIYTSTISIDDIEQYIEKYRPNYIFVDYFTLTKNKRHMYINGNKIKYVNDKVKIYEIKYSIKIFIIVNWIDYKG